MQDAEVKEQEPEEQGEEIEVVEEQQEDEKVDTKTTNQEEKRTLQMIKTCLSIVNLSRNGLANLQIDLERRRQKQSALEYAESIKKQNEELKQKLDKLDTTYVGEFDNRVSAQAQAAKEAYKKALEAGDADALYEAQQNISRVAMEEQKLKDLKASKEEGKS